MKNKNKELLFEISYKCNANCIHCSSINCFGKLAPTDIPKQILDDINVVRISGGEPTYFLSPGKLNEYVLFFKDRGIKTILQTNGSNCNIDTHNIDEIWVSLYGNSNYHDFITRGEELGSPFFTNTMDSIKTFIRRDDKVKIQSTIFSAEQFWSLLCKLNINFVENNIDIPLRLFALLNHGRCNFAYPIEDQLKIINRYKNLYPNIEITCSLDPNLCNFDNKYVMKPDGTILRCASFKQGKKLCKQEFSKLTM